MPATGQRLYKKTVFALQSGQGTPATTGGQIMRRTSSVFSLTRDTYKSSEIVSHQQSTGANAGVGKTSGKLDGELSPGTYSNLFGSLLRKNFAATAAITGASITVTGSGPSYTLTRAAGSFLTDGIKIGDVTRLTAGTFNAANSNKNLLVTGVTATVLTVVVVNGTALVAEGPISSATLSVPGKKSWVPTTGHTDDWYSVEEWYSNVSKSELFTDNQINQAALTLPATGDATVSFDVPGLGRTRGTVQQIVSPAVETTSNVLTAVNGAVLVNGASVSITGAQATINGNIAPGTAEVGSNVIGDLVKGNVEVSGQFTAKFTGTTLQDLFDNQSIAPIVLVIADGTAAAADFITLVMPACKIFSDTPDDGAEIVRTYSFTAQINGSGGAALASLQTIVSMQDSLAA